MKTLLEILNLNRLSGILFYTSIISFIIAFNFSDNPPVSGWQQQFMPNLNNRPLSDVQFIDSLLGYGITGDHTGGDTNYVIKTTNGGDNWVIISSVTTDLSKIKFINSYTGFVCGGPNGTGGFLTKTTNGGMNWFVLNTPFGGYFDDIFVLSEDTIWLTADVGLIGGLFRTTNGGVTWNLQYNGRPAKIYMINSQTGFFSSSNQSFLNKTTDGGFNWSVISGANGFSDIYLADSLTGWKSSDSMRKTTDGGLHWVTQILPNTSTSVIRSFSNVNLDTIWAVGGERFYPGIGERGIIYKTTNGGITWGYQVPDVSSNTIYYYKINFVNKLNGWAYTFFNGVHSVTGGDSITIYTSVKNNNSNLPYVFFLYQNYPNPFNPKTVINYELSASRQGGRVTSFVSLRIYNIQGEETKILVNQKQNSGEYKIEFEGSDLPSGVYFYSLFLDGERVDTKKMMLLK